MRIFISQPLFEKTNEEILDVRKNIIEQLWKKFGKDIEIIDCFQEFQKNLNPIDYLSKNLIQLPKSDLVYFVNGWEDSKNCQLEHECACLYQMNIVYENNEELMKRGKGSIDIFYENHKFFIRGINCSQNVLFIFSQFNPLIISSYLNKNKTINFELAVLNKFEHTLLSKNFIELCKKQSITVSINQEEILETKKNEEIIEKIIEGQKMFEEKIKD